MGWNLVCWSVIEYCPHLVSTNSKICQTDLAFSRHKKTQGSGLFWSSVLCGSTRTGSWTKRLYQKYSSKLVAQKRHLSESDSHLSKGIATSVKN